MNVTRAEKILLACVGGSVAFLPISIALSEPLAYLAAPLMLWVCWRARCRGVGENPFRWLVLAFAMVACLSLLWSIRPALTAAKLDRLLLLGMVFAIPMLMKREHTLDPAAWAWRLAFLFVLGASIQALIDVVNIPWSFRQATQMHDALVQAGDLSPQAHRPTLFDMGNMRDPQMYMVSLSLLVGWVLYRRASCDVRWWWVAALLNTAAFVLHFKRGAWLAFLVSAGLMALLARRRRVVLVLCLAVAAALALPQVRDRLMLIREEFQLETGGRYALWTEVGPRMMAEHPWGLGWKAARHEDFTQYDVQLQPKLNHLHNNALQIRLELGWAGLAIWAAWLLTALVVMWRNFRNALRTESTWVGLTYGVLSGFLALNLNGLVEYNFGDAEIFMLFNFLLALAAAAWMARPVVKPSADAAS